MTQIRFNDYNAEIQTLDELQRFVGLLEPGRFRGYDLFNQTDDLEFTLGHTAGIKHTLQDLSQTGLMSVALTRQGVTIMESAAVGPFTVTANATSNIKIWGVYMRQEFVEDEDGQAATYGLREGDDDGNEPELEFEEKDVWIGFLYIPAVTSSLSNSTWIPSRVKMLGGYTVALLNELNVFTKAIELNQNTSNPTWITMTGWNAGIKGLLIDDSANTFNINPAYQLGAIKKKRNGSIIFLVNTDDEDDAILTYENVAISDAQYDAGYRAVETHLADQVALKVPAGGVAVLHLSNKGFGTQPEKWRVLAISGTFSKLKDLEDRVTTLEVKNLVETKILETYSDSLKSYYLLDYREIAQIEIATLTGVEVITVEGEATYKYVAPYDGFFRLTAQLDFVNATLVSAWSAGGSLQFILTKNWDGELDNVTSYIVKKFGGVYRYQGGSNTGYMNASVPFQAEADDEFHLFVKVSNNGTQPWYFIDSSWAFWEEIAG